MKRIFQIYREAYSGLNHSVWMVSLISLINRMGLMVLPFLSLYLTRDLGYEMQVAGFIMSIFGVGSAIGSLTGGYLSDKIGFFTVVFCSLILGGLLYIIIIFIQGFFSLCCIILLASIVNESVRPALTSSVSYFATAGQITRSFSLLRMAVNLGAGVGPALAGVLAMAGYYWIFIGDGLTSIVAGITWYFVFRNHTTKFKNNNHKTTTHIVNTNAQISEPSKQPIFDLLFITFCCASLVYAIVFFQMWTTLPLFASSVHNLDEIAIGILLALNGIIVFIFEMPLVHRLENKKSLRRIIQLGFLLLGLSMACLTIHGTAVVLYIVIFLMSISEVFAMPFMMTLVMRRAAKINAGKYIGFYSMTWSCAFIIAPLFGASCAENYGYDTLWWILCGLCVLTTWLLHSIIHRMEQTG
jgi:MFS family permease